MFYNMPTKSSRKLEVPEKPKIFFTVEARQKIDKYIELAEGEVSGFGLVDRIGKNFLVSQIYIHEQEASAADVDINSKVLAKFQYEIIKNGLPPETIKLWWHSHADFSPFWSGTDKETIELLSQKWMLSIVGNKAGHWRTRLDIFDPARCTIHGLPLDIYVENDEALHEELKKEIKDKVKKPKPIKEKHSRVRFSEDDIWDVVRERLLGEDPDSTYGEAPTSSTKRMHKMLK